MKKWMGSTPEKCDLCLRPIKASFVDGRTKAGPWAIMCLSCHSRHGVGLGLGFGQRYTLNKEAEWEKTM